MAFAAALLVTLLSGGAAAEPQPVSDERPTHVKSPSTLRTDGGSERRLPPGYFLPEPVWDKLDREVARLQTAETRLSAENASLRDSASALPGWQAGVAVAALGLLVGGACGWYLAR